MGDGLKLSKDKRHRSSSSIAGAGLDGTRSERKLDIRALIPEVDDHFAIAESRCDDLQEKIDLVKLLKRKKKLNKRSMTRVNEAPAPTISENIPYISVRTQPKKKVSQQGTRMRRMEMPPSPVRGYVDPATVEQHRMLGQVWGYGQNCNHQEYQPEKKQYARTTRPRRNRADGDGMCGLVENTSAPAEVACGQDDDASAYSDIEYQSPGDLFPAAADTIMYSLKKKKNGSRKNDGIDDKNSIETLNLLRNRPPWKNTGLSSGARRRQKHPQQHHKQNQPQNDALKQKTEERPVVELFNKSRSTNSPPPLARPARTVSRKEDKPIKQLSEKGDQNELNAPTSDVSAESIKKTLVRRKMRKMNYELPTVASQLKQVDAQYHCSVANCSNIPFVVSKSTAPSHNIGVNIQRVLNGVKMQQPVNGIPMTIAHHMGLGHVPTKKKLNKPAGLSVNKGVINAITMGRRMLTLPSYRCISYNRLLSMYREGDGMVPRFLRTISRPNYIYTSMYDFTHREDIDVASTTTKKRLRERTDPGSVDDTKRYLAEYADIYADYEKADILRKQAGPDSVEAERRCDELLRELLAREEIIKRVVTENVTVLGTPNTYSTDGLRAYGAAVAEARRSERDQPGPL